MWITVGKLKKPVHKQVSKTPPSMLMYYVYVLKIDGEFYIGYTEDLRRRVKQHNCEGKTELMYYEAYLSKRTAMTREKKIKHYGSAWRALKKRITA